MTEYEPRPLHELLSRPMVDIYVGSENTHWILHEKLLCHRSPYFRSIFYNKSSPTKSYGLPDDDDEPFRIFVGWLYSDNVPDPREEDDLTNLLDLYLMGERFGIRSLVIAVLESVRRFYHDNETYPGLRRVQYVYANTEDGSPLRQLLVECIARFLVLGEGIPQHWDKALRKNGQLAVDIILAVQKWKIEEERVPDARGESVVPIVEKKEEEGKDFLKTEEGEDQGQEGLTNGVEGDEQEEGEEGDEGEADGEGEDGEAEEDEGLTNGVKHEEEDE